MSHNLLGLKMTFVGSWRFYLADLAKNFTIYKTFSETLTDFQ